jgi:HEAT repeat protein
MAILALGEIGPDARPAVPYLLEALRDDNEGVRRRAAVALGNIRADGETVVVALQSALNDPSPGVREMVSSALEEIEIRSAISRTAA